MSDEQPPSEESARSFGPAGEQPGARPEDLDEETARARPEDLVQVPSDEAAAAPMHGEEPQPRVNADLLDDPQEAVDLIEQVSGERVEVVSEDDTQR